MRQHSPPSSISGVLLPLTLIALATLIGIPSCREKAGDPIIDTLQATLGADENLILARSLESDAPDDGAAVVVVVAGNGPELRVYRSTGGDPPHLEYRSRQGGNFHNLTLEDIDGDGRDEIVVLWAGGHLEILEVLSRRDDGEITPIFQEAGREVDLRHGPGGTMEFWITSRTYEEGVGEPLTYSTIVYAWDETVGLVAERSR